MSAHTRLRARTKIVATLGPASSDAERLGVLFDAGVNVCRVNFSHGELDQHLRVVQTIRKVASERGHAVAILGDLCGPKIRLNAVRAGVVLKPGDAVRIVRGENESAATVLTTNYARMIDEVEPGQRIYIDDGLLRLMVVDKTAAELQCTCTVGGPLSSRKGVNLPDTRLSVPALTAKDERDLAWAIEHGLDYLALSFVRKPADVQQLRGLIERLGSDIHVVVKIEKVEALEHLDELIGLCDGVMVARGDLGVETDVWRVPLLQKSIIRRTRDAGKPVIVATQMLQSMVNSPMPTRAEVSDVANAILDGADALMLSAETAVGSFPVQAIEIMSRAADETERYIAREAGPLPALHDVTLRGAPRTIAIAEAAVRAARHLHAKLVAVWTVGGETARLVARHRLPMPVLGLTADERVHRRMALLYGVVPVQIQPNSHPGALAGLVDDYATQHNLARVGDLVVLVTSTQPTMPGETDTTLIHRVGRRT